MNRYLEKIAMSSDLKKEVRDTASIGAVGVAGGYLGARLISKFPKIGSTAGKTSLVMGGIGIAGDYAAVKLNKALDKAKISKHKGN